MIRDLLFCNKAEKLIPQHYNITIINRGLPFDDKIGLMRRTNIFNIPLPSFVCHMDMFSGNVIVVWCKFLSTQHDIIFCIGLCLTKIPVLVA